MNTSILLRKLEAVYMPNDELFIKYLRSLPHPAPIPTHMFNARELADLLMERDELKQSCRELQVWMRLMLTVQDECKPPADVIDILRWQDTPEYKEANRVSDNFNFDTITEQEF